MDKTTIQQKEEIIKAFMFGDFKTLDKYSMEDIRKVIEEYEVEHYENDIENKK